MKTRKKKYKNLLNPTERQIKHRNELWAIELEKNPQKATGQMRRGKGRCCLAVAADLAFSCGVEGSYEDEDTSPPNQVAKFFGWKENPGSLLLVYKNQTICDAISLNDGDDLAPNKKGCSHRTIAACVRRTYCQ